MNLSNFSALLLAVATRSEYPSVLFDSCGNLIHWDTGLHYSISNDDITTKAQQLIEDSVILIFHTNKCNDWYKYSENDAYFVIANPSLPKSYPSIR
jgi:hypothetical protein